MKKPRPPSGRDPNASSETLPLETSVLLVVDTELVKQNTSPGGTPAKPISSGSRGLSAFYSSPRGLLGGQGKLSARLAVEVGDALNVRVGSISQNSSDAVLLYRVSAGRRRPVCEPFQIQISNVPEAVIPDPADVATGGLPPMLVDLPSSKATANVLGTGAARLSICFGLYVLDDNGQAQTLRGYYAGVMNLRFVAATPL